MFTCNTVNNFCVCCSLRGTRAKVWQARNERPLFCVKTYASNLERLFLKMWERKERGDKPGHITELSNY
jgi:hypothetical protein